jgi:hypothetical protein
LKNKKRRSNQNIVTRKRDLNCSPELKKDWPGWQVINQHKGFLDQLSLEEVEALYWHWPFWARPDQLPPESDWTSWLMLGGRGAGKTRAGAEWVRTQVERQKSDGVFGKPMKRRRLSLMARRGSHRGRRPVSG